MAASPATKIMLSHRPFPGSRLLPYRMISPSDNETRLRGLVHVPSKLPFSELKPWLQTQAEIFWGLELTRIQLIVTERSCGYNLIDNFAPDGEGQPLLILTLTEAVARKLPVAVENIIDVPASKIDRSKVLIVPYQHSYSTAFTEYLFVNCEAKARDLCFAIYQKFQPKARKGVRIHNVELVAAGVESAAKTDPIDRKIGTYPGLTVLIRWLEPPHQISRTAFPGSHPITLRAVVDGQHHELLQIHGDAEAYAHVLKDEVTAIWPDFADLKSTGTHESDNQAWFYFTVPDQISTYPRPYLQPIPYRLIRADHVLQAQGQLYINTELTLSRFIELAVTQKQFKLGDVEIGAVRIDPDISASPEVPLIELKSQCPDLTLILETEQDRIKLFSCKPFSHADRVPYTVHCGEKLVQEGQFWFLRTLTPYQIAIWVKGYLAGELLEQGYDSLAVDLAPWISAPLLELTDFSLKITVAQREPRIQTYRTQLAQLRAAQQAARAQLERHQAEEVALKARYLAEIDQL